MTGVALIGLGEVGRVFAEDLRSLGHSELTAWDTAFADPQSIASRNADELQVPVASSAETVVGEAELVVSAVTAGHCSAAALASAAALPAGSWYFDLNSSSPEQKRRSARAVDDAGGRYVEAALMSPIGPGRLRSPFLLGGPHAAAFAEDAARWGLTDVTVFSSEVGTAAAAKLCRSVVVKGLEAILTEAMLAARSYGVERDVLDSLPNILPPADWEAVAEYFVSRSLRHGRRRGEEMAEAAATVAQTGIEPLMAEAAAARQLWASQHSDALDEPDLFAMVDHILRSVHDGRPASSVAETVTT